MKTAVSIPDPLFERADALARRLGKSRSQVYREALTEYLARRERTVTEAMDSALEGISDQGDGWFGAAGRQALARDEW